LIPNAPTTRIPAAINIYTDSRHAPTIANATPIAKSAFAGFGVVDRKVVRKSSLFAEAKVFFWSTRALLDKGEREGAVTDALEHGRGELLIERRQRAIRPYRLSVIIITFLVVVL
jgi:hypothetical protein